MEKDEVSKPFRDSYPQIPWRLIIGMRNKLVHDYEGVDDAIVWQVVTVNLPELVVILEKIVPQTDTFA